jgi:hypothetical protein
MQDFYQKIKTMVKENPNDTILGGKIRNLFSTAEDKDQNEVNAEINQSRQIDLEDMINEVENGD